MHRRLFACLILFLFLPGLALAQSAAPQAGFDVKARQVYLIEAETGTVLFARAEDEAVPAASLAKLMTAATGPKVSSPKIVASRGTLVKTVGSKKLPPET